MLFSDDDIVKPEMKQAYEADKKNWLATEKFSEITPGLFKLEFVDTRSAWPSLKCYLVPNETGQNKYSCKGVSKKHNDLHSQRFKGVLDVFLEIGRDSKLEGKDIDKPNNVGFMVYDRDIVTYEQNKLGLSAYYDKRYVLANSIHTGQLDF